MLSKLVNLQTVCRTWDMLYWKLRVNLCQKISFEVLFQLPYYKGLSQIDDALLENLTRCTPAAAEDIFSGFEFISYLPKPCMRFLQAYGSRVKGIEFRDLFCSTAFNALLTAMPNLETLRAKWPSDYMCGVIGTLTALKKLSISLVGCDEKGKGFNHLSNLSCLKELSVMRDLISGESGRFLSAFTHVECLTILANQSRNLFEIANLQKLTHLDITSHICMPLGFISQLTNLTFLSFRCLNQCKLGYENVLKLVQLTALQELHLKSDKEFTKQKLPHGKLYKPVPLKRSGYNSVDRFEQLDYTQ